MGLGRATGRLQWLQHRKPWRDCVPDLLEAASSLQLQPGAQAAAAAAWQTLAAGRPPGADVVRCCSCLLLLLLALPSLSASVYLYRPGVIQMSCTPQRALPHCMQPCPQKPAGPKSSACCWQLGRTSTSCAVPTPSGAR